MTNLTWQLVRMKVKVKIPADVIKPYVNTELVNQGSNTFLMITIRVFYIKIFTAWRKWKQLHDIFKPNIVLNVNVDYLSCVTLFQ